MGSSVAATRESEYTPVSSWCPHPEHWHSADGMATEQEVKELLWGLTRGMQPDVVLETGAYMGETSYLIGRALQVNRHGCLWAIEKDQKLATMAAERCRGIPVQVLVGHSLDWIPPAPIDLAYLDSEIQVRPNEVNHFWPYMRPGAVIVVHDTAPHHRTPEALQHLTRGLCYLNLRTPRGVLLFQVPV